MSTSADWLPTWDAQITAEEFARRLHVRPIETVADLALPDLFETDDEFEAFLADLHSARRADAA